MNPSDPFDFEDFAEALKPENWKEESTTLHTATFEAELRPDGTLFLRGVALREGFSPEAVQSLTRFLSEHVKLPPVAPLYNFEDFHPTRSDE